jgi:phosphohistidine phosphatase
MKLFVLRHGIAEDVSPSGADADRRLTETGKSKLRRVLARAREADVRPATILASPLVRAKETAEIARMELGFADEAVVTDKLVPWGPVAELWEELRALQKLSPLLLCGHNPQLSEFVSAVVGARAWGVDMKKGALACLEIETFGAEPRGTLVWLLTAKTA